MQEADDRGRRAGDSPAYQTEAWPSKSKGTPRTGPPIACHPATVAKLTSPLSSAAFIAVFRDTSRAVAAPSAFSGKGGAGSRPI